MTPALPSHPVPNPQRSLSKDIALLYDQDVAALLNRPRSRDKALLVAAQTYPQESALKTPHSDQKALKDFLVSKGFNPANVRCLKETEGDSQLHPTKRNIERNFDWLVEGVSVGDVVVLYLAGHATQVQNKTGSELDGKDEAFVTTDQPRAGIEDNLILDNTIRKRVVNRLPSGSFLVAITDTCHSGTMLDLDSPSYTRTIPTVSNVAIPSVAIPRCGSPQPEDRRGGYAYVISISACRDHEEAWAQSRSMVQHLLHLLEKHALKPLTPRELEKQLDEVMYVDRQPAIEQSLIVNGKTWNGKWELKARERQKPVVSTIPVHKEIMDRPFALLTQSRPRVSTTSRMARQHSQGSGTR